MGSRFTAIVLDLFDTLVKWNPGALPTIEWQGRQIASTAPLLLERLREACARWTHEVFLDAYHGVMMEVATERDRDGIEVTCQDRFVRTLERMAPPPEVKVPQLAEELTRTHMAAVRAVTRAPAENVAAVRRLARGHRMALLSNFDDSRTGREIVADTGVAELFEAIVISADVALRKPNPAIFRHLLRLLKLAPEQVLFVGDTPHEDVLGAQRAGIPVAWIAKGQREFPSGLEPPEITVNSLAELPDRLGVP